MSASSKDFGEVPLDGSSKAQRERAKRRRWLSGSDEEIAENIDGRLYYRKGHPQLPPLPVTNITAGATNTLNDPQAIIDAVLMLCEVQKFRPHQVYFAFRMPQVRQPDNQYRTLVITGDLSNKPLLLFLIIQIRKFLQQDSRHQRLYIEIIDVRVVHGLYSFAISPSEKDLLDVWQPLFNIVLEEIGKHKEQWLTIEMLHRGIEDDVKKCPATVVITSPNAAEDIWEDILAQIGERVVGLPKLVIELLCGSSLHTCSDDVPPHAQTYQPRVPMGSSIGQEGLQHHSGTAGGMVKLSDGATYALTNHHVVRNDRLDIRKYNQRTYH